MYTVFRWAVRWAPCPSRTRWIWRRWAIGTVWCAADGQNRRCRRRWRRHYRRCIRYRRRRRRRHNSRRWRSWTAVTKTVGSWPSCCSRIWADSRRSGPSVWASPIFRSGCARPGKWDWCRWPSWPGTGSATGSGHASLTGRPDRSATSASGNTQTRRTVRFSNCVIMASRSETAWRNRNWRNRSPTIRQLTIVAYRAAPNHWYTGIGFSGNVAAVWTLVQLRYETFSNKADGAFLLFELSTVQTRILYDF